MIEKEENSMINKAKAVFCNHPFTDGVKDKPIYIDNNNIGNFIYPDFGLDYSDLNYMYLSTPNLTVCSMEIGPGGFFNPPDYHPGMRHILYWKERSLSSIRKRERQLK